MQKMTKKTGISMGESKKLPIFDFDHSLKLEFCGTKITSNAGLLIYRELDEAFGLTEKLANKLTEFRIGNNTQHKLLQLTRQSIYSRLAGYEDVNDADLLKQDPALRIVAGGNAKEKLAASTSEMNRFETEYLTKEENIEVLRNINGEWINCINSCNNRQKLNHVILDIDSSESQTYGNQERSTFNGYFGCTCYHPLFCFNQYGDLEGALLRGGSVHSANNWKTILEPIVDRYGKNRNSPNKKVTKKSLKKETFKIYIRGDAAFGSPEFYEYAENKGAFYTVRLKANSKLYASVEHLLKRPTGRPSYKPKVYYHNFKYQAESWNKARRVVAKIEWHYDELFPRIGFIVTNLNWSSKNIIKFYNKRGTAEQWIKEGKNAVKWTKLSCKKFIANEVRLLLFGLAYNLGNFLRTMVLPKNIAKWTLTTLREKLIKLGAKVIKHARYVRFQMAEFIVSETTFGKILQNIHRLQFAPG